MEQGSQVAVEWRGPKNSGDRLVMVRRESGAVLRSARPSKKPSPFMMTAPEEPGEYELRLTTNEQRVLARAVFLVEAAAATIRVSKSVVSKGKKFFVDWTGPGNAGNRVGLYDAAGKRLAQRSARKKHRLSFRAPKVAGVYELRLELASGAALATTKITVR